jgi:D-beta-D-heptose 7-phosphate kinase/D-beta-D-heptose 1-phosphate adenosyltransferase
MRRPDKIIDKIHTLSSLLQQVVRWRLLNKTISFTNGCFDILHQGHIFSLSEAAKEADFLVVGVNADQSVRKLKGKGRPINDQQSRAIIIASLLMVDAVIIFEEDTPLELIKSIQPDTLVKGGDYKVEEIAGSKEVLAKGGRVIINPLLKGFSSSDLINKIKLKT